ncbi:MAG: ABC transporter ATP-binding protein [Egibacteraceae bacterium]
MLEAAKITKRYRGPVGPVTVLDGADLRLSPGQRLGLVGPSGCGKSTLARILALLVAADAGHVTIDGTPVRGHGLRVPPTLRRQVQLLWQSPRQAADPRLRLAEAILEPLAAHGQLPESRPQRQRLLDDWAEVVGLTPDLLDRQPHEVSDGQLQRACLARALILRPPYLICDELGSMLDVSTQAALLHVIAQQQKSHNLGVLLISHDRLLVHHWCDTKLALPHTAPLT